MGTKLLLVVLLFAVGGIAFYFGDQGGYKRGSDYGYSKARNEAPKVDLSKFVLSSEYELLRGDYNKLVDDYSTLAQSTSAVQYQPRRPTSCTSYDYGLNSTNTTCY